MSRNAIFGVVLMLAMLATGRRAAALDDAQIAADVASLSDPDCAVRDRATSELWTAGRAAEPFLQLALQSADPEAAHRARAILMRFELGVFPDTPPKIVDLIQQYRMATPVHRPRIVSLLSDEGPRGLRVLMALRNREKDPSIRQMILDAIGARPHEREGAALMIVYGDVPAAEAVLQAGSLAGKSSARDWAALLLVHGGLNEQIAELKKRDANNADVQAAMRLVFLARAASDLNLATIEAEKTSDPNLLDSILIESGDWKRLAVRYGQRRLTSSDSLGLAAAFCRLSGDAPGFEANIAALQSFADHHDDAYSHCAQCLMLNNRIDEGIAVLMAHRDYAATIDFLVPRLELKEAIALEEKIDSRLKNADALHLRARLPWTYHFIGDNPAALQRLDDVARANRKGNDLATWYLLADAARELNKPDLADEYLAAALMLPSAGDGVAAIEKAGLPDGFPAGFWWRFIRNDKPTETYEHSIARLRQFAAGKLPAADVDALAQAAEHAAHGRSTVDRELMLMPIAHTYIFLKRLDDAANLLNRLIEGAPTPSSLQLLGDCQAEGGDFTKAAGTYERAWGLDQTRAVPLALKGWALQKSGAAVQAREAIEMAHLLPLSDETQRTALQEAFAGHGLDDDARREREYTLKTGSFLSWNVCNANRLNGDDRFAHGDSLGAADAWERAFLGNYQTSISFIDPWANASTPAMIRKARAIGLAKSSPPAALAEAQTAMKEAPGDANALIDMVLAFEQAGHKAEADFLYVPTVEIYEKICTDFPKSGMAQNQLAWVQTRCRRNLDQAVTHARRAVELEPANTASIDTLAEAYFARGEIQQAIEQMQKCAELEPNVARHREQIARFKAALTGGGN